MKWSPEQISDHLAAAFPDRAEMRVCPETIYQALYVQGRGHLRADLHQHLRTGRAVRRPRRSTAKRAAKIPDMILISERPAEVADRAVPGHWEGDLILGSNCRSAIATLVERQTRYTMLVHLPGDHGGAVAVRDGLLATIKTLPEHLRESLTWDHTPALSLPLTGGGSADDLALGTGADGRFSLIVFFRGLHCPVCRKPLGELDRRLGDLREAGVGRVLAVSMETPERSTQLVQEWHLGDLPVAHGLSEASAREWGLFVSTAIKDGEAPVFNEPGVFVLDADGTVYWSNVSSMPFGRPALDDVLAGLQFAQQQDYPARGAA